MKRVSVYGLILLLLLAAVLSGLAWQQAADAWVINEDATLLESMLFYQSYLMPFFLLWVILGIKSKQVSKGFAIVGVVGALLGIYARFVEPNVLIIKQTHITTGYKLKVALVSDLHYGLFSTAWQIQHLVDKLNSLDVDAIVVAGDWTHQPSQSIDLVTQLQPFSQLKKPVYSVMGNHDEQANGRALTQALKQALIANGVQPIEGQSIDLGKVRLAGIADLLPANTRQERLQALKIQDKPLLLLTHNPDSLYRLPKLTQPFVMLAGHTHGGQVNLPIVTQYILKVATIDGYQRGLYPLSHQNQLFVTSGIGMVGLPLRFFMPPTIDVLVFE